MGRPSTFTQEIADVICDRIADGESLRAVCNTDDGMPSKGTVLRWLAESETFQVQYARAREEQADKYADEIIEIADEDGTTEKENVGVVYDSTAVARNRLRVDARKWVASKLKPKKYGDKLALGGDEENPLVVKVIKLSDA